MNKLGWRVVESPAVLNDQSLRSDIYLRAIDKRGNERVAVVKASSVGKWYEKISIWYIILIVIVIGLFLWKKMGGRLKIKM